MTIHKLNDENATNEKQVGIVLVSHGNMAEAMLGAAEMVVGKMECCISVGLSTSGGVDDGIEHIRDAVHKADAGAGVLILTDLFGGTPTTLSLSMYKTDNIEVIAGANLPMVIKAMQQRDKMLKDLAADVKKAGRQGIVVAGEMLGRR
ncbi:MAG: PTS sugar transporter subunit IIA [Desulfovibrio sp.]